MLRGMAVDIREALTKAAEDFSEVARWVRDPNERVKATPEWTVADLVAHVAIESDRYRRELEGESDWAASVTEIAAANRAALTAHEERDVDLSLDWMGANVRAYVDRLSERELDVPSHHLDGGLHLTPRQGGGVLLGELVVHRRDLARALGRDAGVAREEAALVLDGALATLPAMVDRDAARGHVGVYELRVRRHATYTLQVDGEQVTVTPGRAARRDVVLSVDPVTFLLVSYGRRGNLRAAISGGVLAWGRRPDRIFALDRLFHRV